MRTEMSPWAEPYRDYLHALAARGLTPVLRGKIDLYGVVQDTLLEACGRPEPADPDHARRLLRVVFFGNLQDAIRYWRADKRDARRDCARPADIDPLASVAGYSTPSERAMRHEAEHSLLHALDRLTDNQRAAVTLHYLAQMTVGEVARAMDTTVPAVAGLLVRGLSLLRRHLVADPLPT